MKNNDALQKCQKKRSAFFSLIEKEGFFYCLRAVLFCFLIVMVETFFIWVNTTLFSLPFFESFCLSFVEILALAVVAAIIFSLFDYFKEDVPVLLRKRNLPLNEEDVANLNMDKKEFATFLEDLCSYRYKNGTRSYKDRMFEDVRDSLVTYCKYCAKTEAWSEEKKEYTKEDYAEVFDEVCSHFSSDMEIFLRKQDPIMFSKRHH